MMKKPLMNPYLPSWEYIPDAEPHVFGDRVYIYGSHDRFNGWVFCLNDYVCWSAPVDDLSDWRYEGVIYRKVQDPRNADGEMNLFAPDVTQGPDGRYYLYYVLDKLSVVGVAVCDTPAGEYQYLGCVHYPDGVNWGERPGDEAPFDPGLLTEGDRTYLYAGGCGRWDPDRKGPMVVELDKDMLTILSGPVTIAPSVHYSKGSGYEGHEYFEAASMRKVNDKYYFIYSSIRSCELCYAVSDHPTHGFKYGGVIIANDDSNIDSYKPAEKSMYYANNTHGSIEYINGQWYVFYHRHTNGMSYSRQACLEKINILPDGSIPQVMLTSSCGFVLPGKGEYPAYTACNIFRTDAGYPSADGRWLDGRFPKITQEGADGDETPGYLYNLGDGWNAGFKFYDCKGVKAFSVRTRSGAEGWLNLKLKWDGEPIARIPIHSTNQWKTSAITPVDIPDGVQELYFGFEGRAAVSLDAFTLYTEDMLEK